MFLKGSHCHTYQLREAPCGDLKIKIRTCQVFHWVLNEVEGCGMLRWISPSCNRAVFIIGQGMCVECLLCARHRCTRGEQTWQAKRTRAHMNLYLYPAHNAKKQKMEFISMYYCYVTLRSNFTNESPFITASMLISKSQIHQWRLISDPDHALSKTVQYYSR